MRLALVIQGLLTLAACGSKDAPAMPGGIYYMTGTALVRHGAGVIAEDVFPSQYALPDGRIVAIASEEETGEQLALVGKTVERIGPVASQVRSPAIVGNAIVYEAKVEPHSELYRLDLATQQVTQLTNNPEGNFAPATLGANAVVFSSSRDGDAEIYKLDLATNVATRLTAFHRDDWGPTVHGTTIAFMSDREGPPHIFLMEADGTSLRRLTASAEEDSEPTWSPNGKLIAYITQHRLHIRDLATGADATVTQGDAVDTEPAWSPDGKWLAVTRTEKNVGDIWVYAIDGKTSRRLTTTRQDEHLARWHTLVP